VPVPHVEQDCGPLPIRGNVPDARNPQCGCRFHDRCPIAIALPRKKGGGCARSRQASGGVSFHPRVLSKRSTMKGNWVTVDLTWGLFIAQRFHNRGRGLRT
jgi:hypothetical protein